MGSDGKWVNLMIKLTEQRLIKFEYCFKRVVRFIGGQISKSS